VNRSIAAESLVSVSSNSTRPARIAEVDLHAGVEREADVLAHLLAAIPGQRAAEMVRECTDRVRQRVLHVFGDNDDGRAQMPCRIGYAQKRSAQLVVADRGRTASRSGGS